MPPLGSGVFPRPPTGTLERIKCGVEVLTRMELSSDAMVRVLTEPEWEARRQRLAKLDKGARK